MKLFSQVKHTEIELTTAVKLLNDQRSKAKEDSAKAAKCSSIQSKKTDEKEKEFLVKRQVAIASKKHYLTSVEVVNERMRVFSQTDLPALLKECEAFEKRRIDLLLHTFRGIWKAELETSKLMLHNFDGLFEQLKTIVATDDARLIGSTLKSGAPNQPVCYEVESFETTSSRTQRAKRSKSKSSKRAQSDTAHTASVSSTEPLESALKMLVLEDFEATEANTVGVCKNEPVLVLQADPSGSGWTQVRRCRDGAIGFVPTNYLAALITDEQKDSTKQYQDECSNS